MRVKSLSLFIFMFIGCSPAPLAPTLLSPTAPNLTQQSTPAAPKLYLRIKQAQFEIPAVSLNQQVQQILSLSQEQRLRQVQLRLSPGEQLQLQGKVKAKSWLPELSFSIIGKISVQPGNIIRFQAERVSIAGLPVTTLLDILGVELAHISQLKDPFGRIVQKGNTTDLIIDKFSQDAHLEGKLTAIQTTSEALTIHF